MSDAIISVENLGKKYAIRHQAQRGGYKTLRETLVRKTASLFSRQDRQAAQARTREDFWALKDVSFDLERGKVLGIIGRNGAGKSTLLKILSRITEPSEGRVTLRGRVASLLEVGTGFHQELTGRENILLNGSILGMSRLEIRRKFDEIIAFAGVEKFLDTPVKRYSSGMYVRLAFAVAAHLEPEILIVDEVLAVGDVQFQAKCMGKMQEVASREGRTVLFVSHNLPAILRLCQSCCWIARGHVEQFGPTQDVVSSYLQSSHANLSDWTRAGHSPPSIPHITQIRVRNGAASRASTITATDPITMEVEVLNSESSTQYQLAIRISTSDGIPVLTTTSSDQHCKLTVFPLGASTFTITIPANFLSSGSYDIICAILIPGGPLIDVVADKVGFHVHQGLNHATFFQDQRLGIVTPKLEWRHEVSAQISWSDR
jgi:lipopolysaccharide transport system ATP-binding protein